MVLPAGPSGGNVSLDASNSIEFSPPHSAARRCFHVDRRVWTAVLLVIVEQAAGISAAARAGYRGAVGAEPGGSGGSGGRADPDRLRRTGMSGSDALRNSA